MEERKLSTAATLWGPGSQRSPCARQRGAASFCREQATSGLLISALLPAPLPCDSAQRALWCDLLDNPKYNRRASDSPRDGDRPALEARASFFCPSRMSALWYLGRRSVGPSLPPLPSPLTLFQPLNSALLRGRPPAALRCEDSDQLPTRAVGSPPNRNESAFPQIRVILSKRML